MSPKEARHALSQDIGTALGEAWTIYANPPESVNAPAVVLSPRSPYRVKSTVCNEEVRLTATVMMQRAASVDGLDALDDTCTTIRDAVHASAVMSVVDAVQDIGVVQEAGGVQYLTAFVEITVQI